MGRYTLRKYLQNKADGPLAQICLPPEVEGHQSIQSQ